VQESSALNSRLPGHDGEAPCPPCRGLSQAGQRAHLSTKGKSRMKAGKAGSSRTAIFSRSDLAWKADKDQRPTVTITGQPDEAASP